ncbi:MAG: hypothetical protein HZB46_00560 [Solirubrobacterales bacterium]|nr:hypothetical protein [Solirubrobacterales bacterium]
MSSREPLERVAAAAERIADALEYLTRQATPAGPQPQLKIARAPTDTSRMEAVTLRPEEGLMTAIIQNTGDADTLVSDPRARLGDVEVVGTLIDRDSQTRSSLTVPAAAGGPGVQTEFRFERHAHLLADLPLVLRFPHQPGRWPGESLLEVRLEPAGLVGGRHTWRVTDSTTKPAADAAA